MKYTVASLVPIVAVVLHENVSQVASFQTLHYNNQYRCHREQTLSASTFAMPKHASNERRISGPLSMANNDSDKDDFWQQQRDLMNQMSDQEENAVKEENTKTFRKVQNSLLTETIFFSTILFSLLWLACDNPFVPLSYVFGSVFGLAYTYGLGRFVETVGGTIDDAATVEGAGVGQARFAFLILLFIFVGKFRSYGLVEIPSIMGFFTYQLASLAQGLKEEKIE